MEPAELLTCVDCRKEDRISANLVASGKTEDSPSTHERRYGDVIELSSKSLLYLYRRKAVSVGHPEGKYAFDLDPFTPATLSEVFESVIVDGKLEIVYFERFYPWDP